MLTDPEYLKTLTNDALRTGLKNAIKGTASGVQRASEILLELELRGVRHGFAKDGAFRWYREIATGKLHPTAALLIYDRATINGLMLLPLDRQEAIATGEPLPVVEYAAGGEMVTVEKKIDQISLVALQRVIGPEGVRDEAAQTWLLREQDTPKPSKNIPPSRVYAQDGKIKVGTTFIELNELIEPLLTLGFKLVRTKAT